MGRKHVGNGYELLYTGMYTGMYTVYIQNNTKVVGVRMKHHTQWPSLRGEGQ